MSLAALSFKDEIRDQGANLERLKAFSDGVFAIAITLLVLDVRVPDLPTNPASFTFDTIVAILPNIFSFLVTFFTVALYWICHHWFFQMIVKYDRRLLWINMFFLLFVSFQPFPAAVMGRYYESIPAWILYSANLSAMGLCLARLWFYASRNGLLRPDLTPRLVSYVTYRSLLVPVVFLLSIPVAFINLQTAQFFPFSIQFISIFMQRHYAKRNGSN